MNNRALIRALVGVVGIFAIVEGLVQLQSLSMMLGLAGPISKFNFNWPWGIAASALVPLLLFLVGGVLLFSPPKRLFQMWPEGDAQADQRLSPLAICRVAAMFSGVLVLVWCLPKIIRMVVGFTYCGGRYEEVLATTWPTLVGFILQLAIGVYLLLGAPHLVRWQVRKIEDLRQSRQLPEA
jgi:hypothetical protein